MNFSDFCKLVELRHSKFHFSVGSYLRDGETEKLQVLDDGLRFLAQLFVVEGRLLRMG